MISHVHQRKHGKCIPKNTPKLNKFVKMFTASIKETEQNEKNTSNNHYFMHVNLLLIIPIMAFYCNKILYPSHE